jgi:hypothetical protein
VPEEGVLLYRRRGEEREMNLDAAGHHNSDSSYIGAEERRGE